MAIPTQGYILKERKNTKLFIRRDGSKEYRFKIVKVKHGRHAVTVLSRDYGATEPVICRSAAEALASVKKACFALTGRPMRIYSEACDV